MKRNKRAGGSEIDLLIDGAGTEQLSAAMRSVHEQLALGQSVEPGERFVAQLRSTLDRERLGVARRGDGRKRLVSARWLAAALVVLLIGGLGVATTLRFGGVHQLESTPGSRPAGGVSLPAATPSRREPCFPAGRARTQKGGARWLPSGAASA